MASVSNALARGFGRGRGRGAATAKIDSRWRKHSRGQVWGLNPGYNVWLNPATEPRALSNSLTVDITAGDLAMPILTPNGNVALLGGDMNGTEFFGQYLGQHWPPSSVYIFNIAGGFFDLTTLDGTVDLASNLSSTNPYYNWAFSGVFSTASSGNLDNRAIIGFEGIVNGTFQNCFLLGGGGTSLIASSIHDDPRDGSLFRNNAIATQTNLDIRRGIEIASWKVNLDGLGVEAIPFDQTTDTFENVYPDANKILISTMTQAPDGLTTITTAAPHGLDTRYAGASRADHLKPLGPAACFTGGHGLTTSIASTQATILAHSLTGSQDIKVTNIGALEEGPSTIVIDTNGLPTPQYAYISYAAKSGSVVSKILNCTLLNPSVIAAGAQIIAGYTAVQGIPAGVSALSGAFTLLEDVDWVIYDFPSTTKIRVQTNSFALRNSGPVPGDTVTPTGPTPGYVIPPRNIYDDITEDNIDAPLSGVVPAGGISIGSRMYMYVTPTTLNSVQTYSPGLWLAWSDDEGQTWTYPAGGAPYDTTAGGLTWPNDENYLGIMGGAPASNGDGYVYILVNRQNDAPSMMRVPEGDIEDKTAYDYWNGTTWVNNDPTVLYTIGSHLWADTNGAPIMWWDDHTQLWWILYLQLTVGSPGYFGGFVFRSAHRPEGPWTQAQYRASPTISPAPYFYNYGGFRHPASGQAPQQRNWSYNVFTLGSAYVPVVWYIAMGNEVGGPIIGRGYGRAHANEVTQRSEVDTVGRGRGFGRGQTGLVEQIQLPVVLYGA